jgi:copper chaperone
MEQANLQIEGMSCGHCVAAVKRALDALPGVQVDSVEVGAARVQYDPAAVSRDQITAAVADEGYAAAIA